MRTKKLIPFFTVGIILFAILSCKNVPAQDNISEEQVIIVLKSFYTNYITKCSILSPRGKEIADSIVREYGTANLVKEFENPELDYDPFTKSQNIDLVMLKTLTIKKDPKKSNLFYISYFWPYGMKQQITIKLTVVKVKDCYKIDYVFLGLLEESQIPVQIISPSDSVNKK